MNLVVCSHRGPAGYTRAGGRIHARPGSGGLVTALSGVVRGTAEVSWIACALTDLDHEVASGRPVHGGGPVSARLLTVPPAVHRRFYEDACVTGLGFLFHGLVDQAHTPTFDQGFQEAWEAYRTVNRAYAEAVAASPPDRTVLVEDYHLMLVAAEVRALAPDSAAPLAYFHHVPWCAPAYFALLPRRLRTEVLAGMLAFDTVAFHARTWADRFLACCAEFLPGADCAAGRVRWQGREVSVVVAPAQLDVPHVRDVLAGDQAERWRERMNALAGPGRTLVRVDRVDLWKNIVRGFRAFERMVTDDGADDVTFLAILAKSRLHVPQYRAYLTACLDEARRVNERLAPGREQGPVQVLLDEPGDHARALAGLSVADAVLVNSTCDGLNLVAKEAVIAGGGTARLVLSETTGVYERLGRWTHGIHPFDIEETATALRDALREPAAPPELHATVAADSPDDWVRRRLSALPGFQRDRDAGHGR